MITREQLVDVEDRRKLLQLGLAASIALAIAFLAFRVVVVVLPSHQGGDPTRAAPAASEGVAGADRREVRP